MDYIRAFLQGVRVGPSNEELGRRTSVYPQQEIADGRPSMQAQSMRTADYEEPSAVLETSDKLKEFRMLVGITTHPSFKAPKGYNTKIRPVVTTRGRPAPNLGIYPTVVGNEWKTKRNYRHMSQLINTCLGLQIVLAAALTALGASNGSHHAVTVFGAINTVIAGFLTYLKGSGLPMRFKYYAHEWSKIREYIEQRERDLGISHHDIDVHQEVEFIRQMYEEVRGDIEANTPDRFVSSTGHKSASLAMSRTPALMRHLDDHSDSDGGLGNLKADISAVKSQLASKVKDVEAVEQGLHSRADLESKRVMVLSEKEASNIVEDRAKEVGDLEKQMQSAGTDFRDTINSAIDSGKL